MIAMVVAACSDDGGESGKPATSAPTTTAVGDDDADGMDAVDDRADDGPDAELVTGPDGYAATIRRTDAGVAHVQAEDWGGLGFGQGYAFAEDHACTLLDRVVKARGEWSRWHGPGDDDEYLNSDLALSALDLMGRAAEDLEAQPQRERDMVEGYAAGFNAYLDHAEPTGWCAGEEWVGDIDAVDLMAVYKELLLYASAGQFYDLMATAAPPESAAEPTDGAVEDASAFDTGDDEIASNGWAIGAEASETGSGMLVANPHFPWEGALRLWETHLTIPGEVDVYGAGLLGVPGVLIGFNDAVAWTHTVSAGSRFTAYRLDLADGDPTSYVVDGETVALDPVEVSVEVLGDDGTVDVVERTLWFSEHGPMVNFPGFGWTDSQALSFRDGNIDNTTFLAQFLDMNSAASMDEFIAAHENNLGIPWVNTISVSADGRAWYTDSTPTPNLSDETIAAWQEALATDPIVGIAESNGVVLLDGSTSANDWVDEPGARGPGLVPWDDLPKLERSDWVFNSNDSYWLTNPDEPLTGLSPLHGLVETARTPRTRMNLTTLTDDSAEGPRGDDGLWSSGELRDAALSNRAFTALAVLDDVLAACDVTPTVEVDGTQIDLSKACEILAGWDGTADVDSPGAPIFREWIHQYESDDLREVGDLFAEPFDPVEPIATPAGLGDGELALSRLGQAVINLETAGFPLDVTFGDLQYTLRGDVRVAIHGGTNHEGIENSIGYNGERTTTEPVETDYPAVVDGSSLLTGAGYPVNRGTSFIMVTEFSDDGPQGWAFLAYGQSGDRDSALHLDQTEAFSAKDWQPVRFTEADVSEATEREYTVTG